MCFSTGSSSQLRILIGLERNCQQMRWLVENEIPPCSPRLVSRVNDGVNAVLHGSHHKSMSSRQRCCMVRIDSTVLEIISKCVIQLSELN
jgi:hypothetical protein